MKKKFISLLLGLSMVAAVTGCSSKPKETEAETKAATEAVVTEAATEEKAVETEAVTEAAVEVETEAVTEAAAAAETEAVTEAAAEVETEAVTEAAAEVETEAVTEAAAEVETEAVTEAAAEIATEAVTEVETEAVTEAAAEVETEAVTEAVEEVVTEAVTEAVAEVETEAVTEAAAEVETEAVTEAAAEVETEAVTEAVAEVETEAVTEAAAEVETEAVTEAVEEVVTEAVTEAAAEVETEAVTEEATEAVTEAAAEVETEAVTEEATEAVTEAAAEVETEAITEEATEAVTEAAAEVETEAVTEAVEEVETEAVTEAVEEVTEAVEEDEEDVTEVAEIDIPIIPIIPHVDDTVTRGTVDDFGITENDIVVLYNNDVHGGVCPDADYSGSSLSLGYAGMAAVAEKVYEQAGDTTLVDLGDAIQGSVVTTETDGQCVMDMMSAIGYDILIPGNHEFDYGMDAFLEYAQNASGEFISSNFIDTRTGESIFDGYTLEEYEVNDTAVTVGYVGMTTPETIAKSTPTYFQDEEGNYIYGFDAETPQDLYDNIQASIDAAYEDGADIVIGLGHMGDSGVEPGWSSIDVIENTTGLSAFLDGHAHTIIPGRIIKDKEGNDVILSSTGTKLEHIGLMKLSVSDDGNVDITTGLVDDITEEEEKSEAYAELNDMVQALEDEYAYLMVKVGNTDFDLVVYDPESGDRLIRNAETNLGNFLSDVYRNYFQTDIGFINGGSIRANIDAGEINYLDLITVYPWNTTTGVVEVSGQVILDCLEKGARLWPEEEGGWIQPSGITYMIDTTIPSSVVLNSDGEFVSVDGEYRVKNVMVGDEPLDLEKDYTLAINTYYSQEYGDGMTMFKGCKVLVPAAGEDEIVDHDVVIDYLASIGEEVPEEYADPYGQGRITIITEDNKELLEAVQEEAVTEVAGELEEAVSEAFEEAEEMVSEAAEAVEEAVSEAAEEIESEVSELVPRVAKKL